MIADGSRRCWLDIGRGKLMHQKWPSTASMDQKLQPKRSVGRAGRIIFSLAMLILLAGCGSSSAPSTDVTPTPRPSPTSCPGPTPTQGITPTPCLSPTPPKPSPCDTPPGVVPPSSVEVDQGDTSQSVVALTFDAGGPADPTARILTILAKHHNHSTWFITGDWAKQNPDLVRRVWNGGHEIGNHTAQSS